MHFVQEYFASGQRKGRTQTADERLYGIFAEDSDEEYEGRKGKRKRKEQDSYSKPVGFVSGGITGSSTERPADIEQAERDFQPDGQHENQGLGFGGAGLGLGAQPSGRANGASDPDMNPAPGLGSAPGLGFAAGGTNGGLPEDDMRDADLPNAFGARYILFI